MSFRMLEIKQVSDQNKTQAVKRDFTDSRLCDISLGMMPISPCF